jgi:hypothetical protein
MGYSLRYSMKRGPFGCFCQNHKKINAFFRWRENSSPTINQDKSR